jgi:hypothetical protein
MTPPHKDHDQIDADTARQLLDQHAHEPEEDELEIIFDMPRQPGTEEEEREHLLAQIISDEKRGDAPHADWCRHRLANLHEIWNRNES